MLRSPGKLVVAITAGTMFDFEEAQQVATRDGSAAYRRYQVEFQQKPLDASQGMPLVRALLGVTDRSDQPLIEVVVVSPDDGDSGVRVLNSVEQWSLPITQLSFTGGRSALSYLSAYGTDLFLSSEPSEVSAALRSGHAAARVCPADDPNAETDEVRLGFDTEGFLFESQSSAPSGTTGPFSSFLEALSTLQSKFGLGECPVRTVLLNAGGLPFHMRAIETLRRWNVASDESHMVGIAEKSRVFDTVRPHISFETR